MYRSVLPEPELDFEAYAAALVVTLREHPADATIAVIDSSVEALHRHRDAIGRLTAPAIGSKSALDVALSKDRTLEVARVLGLPTPRSVLVSTAADLDGAVAEIGTPCVFKPVTSWRPIGLGGERVSPVYVASAEGGGRVGAALLRPGAALLVQEFAGGRRETIKLFRTSGRTHARFAMIVDRAWPPLGGSSVMRHTTPPPADTLEFAERLVAEIGLEGYSEVEFRRDAANRPLLMEINPRLSQSVELATRAGVDFPRMQLEWARGGVIPQPPAHIAGLRLGWLAGDLRLLVGAFAGSPPPRPQLGKTVRSIASDYVLHRARLEGFDLHDYRPTLGALGFAARGLARRRH